MEKEELYLHEVPIELLILISEYLDYEDIVVLEKLVNKSILSKVLHITSRDRYLLETAPRVPLEILDTRITSIDDSVLVQVNSLSDFNRLLRFEKLKQANFVLPHNKYESITEFKKYLEVFFDFFFGRGYTGKYKDLVFRIFFSSDYNAQLGITIYKGFVNLINSHKYVGYNIDYEEACQHDFLIDIINTKKNKYEREVNLFYNLDNSLIIDNLEDEDFDIGYIFNSNLQGKYIDNKILPLCIRQSYLYEKDFTVDKLINIDPRLLIDSRINLTECIDRIRSTYMNMFTEDHLIVNCIYKDSQFYNTWHEPMGIQMMKVMDAFKQAGFEGTSLYDVCSFVYKFEDAADELIEATEIQSKNEDIFNEMNDIMESQSTGMDMDTGTDGVYKELMSKLSGLLVKFKEIYAHDNFMKCELESLDANEYDIQDLAKIINLYDNNTDECDYIHAQFRQLSVTELNRITKIENLKGDHVDANTMDSMNVGTIKGDKFMLSVLDTLSNLGINANTNDITKGMKLGKVIAKNIKWHEVITEYKKANEGEKDEDVDTDGTDGIHYSGESDADDDKDESKNTEDTDDKDKTKGTDNNMNIDNLNEVMSTFMNGFLKKYNDKDGDDTEGTDGTKGTPQCTIS